MNLRSFSLGILLGASLCAGAALAASTWAATPYSFSLYTTGPDSCNGDMTYSVTDSPTAVAEKWSFSVVIPSGCNPENVAKALRAKAVNQAGWRTDRVPFPSAFPLVEKP